jgi:hypothetical protein
MPVAELRPVAPRRFVSRDALVDVAPRVPRIDAKRFRKDVDRVVDPSING